MTRCKSQQDQFLRLHQAVGDDVISITIDVNPHEDAALIRDHATSNGFNWIYAVALGALVAGGVILFMLVVGLVFTAIIETSLTRATPEAVKSKHVQ